MQKIPSLFKRDYEGTRQVYDEVVEASQWVVDGEGVATLKIDGTSCMIRDGKLYKRYDAKNGKKPPEGWEAAEEKPDPKTGHWPGWLPVGDGPDDARHREAFARLVEPKNGTYELIGPKVQSNPYKLNQHELWPHSEMPRKSAPRTFEELKAWFADHVIEGIVWHHPDGRMAKIKRKDFGYKWPE